ARDEWPDVVVVHAAFQLMVGSGVLMMVIAMWGALGFWRRRRLPEGVWFLRALVLASPAGMIAIEAGWTVTEVGRQPWIIYGVMRTAQAVTPMPGLFVPFLTFTILYLFLSAVVVWLLFRQVAASPRVPLATENEATRAPAESKHVVA
ncbi:MAG TPA: cytochrome ubiquinol oxidase subunit I, partial [Pyrinomonadaceae bacterium]|nr:cytochrome ubiquinol oxidase subunit I [Pyrinomonadaceae bacterium]